MGWADKNDWKIALTLSHYIIESYTSFWVDPRLGAPLSSLRPLPLSELTYSTTNQKTKVAIIGIDLEILIGLKEI
jgi:hypothetical protein